MRLFYLGHASFLLHAERAVIGLDPWVSDNPSTPTELKSLPKLDLIALTHGHYDHAGDAVNLAFEFGCPVAARRELLDRLIADGLPEGQTLELRPGQVVRSLGLDFTLVRADHPTGYRTRSGERVPSGEPCGLIVQGQGKTLYHLGDTNYFDEMSQIGTEYAPDVALIPIGGGYTMGPEDGAKAAKDIKTKLAVPIHFGTFAELEQSPDAFVDACRQNGIETSVLAPGDDVSL